MTVTALGTVFRCAPRRRKRARRSGPGQGQGRGAWRIGSGPAAEPDGANERAGGQDQPIDAAVATSWAEGRLTFSNTPLQAAVAEVNRYLTDKIEIDAPGTVQTPISGVFRAGDRAAFVSAASDVFDLEAVAQPGGAIKLVPRGQKSLTLTRV